jgi:hypothetical protein
MAKHIAKQEFAARGTKDSKRRIGKCRQAGNFIGAGFGGKVSFASYPPARQQLFGCLLLLFRRNKLPLVILERLCFFCDF